MLQLTFSQRKHKNLAELILATMLISSNWLALKAKGVQPVKGQRADHADREVPVRELGKKNQFTNFIALDCEMVEGASVEHMLARVSLVDYEGRVVYDVFVKPREKVIDYRTHITGITREVLGRRGEPFKVVRAKVIELMKDKIVVGHAVHHDFEALEMPHPGDEKVRDTCSFPPLRPPKRKTTPSLRLLAEYWLDKQVQQGTHSSIEDARTAMILYKRMQVEWEKMIKDRQT